LQTFLIAWPISNKVNAGLIPAAQQGQMDAGQIVVPDLPTLRSKFAANWLVIALLALVMVVAIGTAAYFWRQSRINNALEAPLAEEASRCQVLTPMSTALTPGDIVLVQHAFFGSLVQGADRLQGCLAGIFQVAFVRRRAGVPDLGAGAAVVNTILQATFLVLLVALDL
jgi:hypothetical protein